MVCDFHQSELPGIICDKVKTDPCLWVKSIFRQSVAQDTGSRFPSQDLSYFNNIILNCETKNFTKKWNLPFILSIQLDIFSVRQTKSARSLSRIAIIFESVTTPAFSAYHEIILISRDLNDFFRYTVDIKNYFSWPWQDYGPSHKFRPPIFQKDAFDSRRKSPEN